MIYRIVWNDGSNAKYNSIEDFLNRIKAEAQNSSKEEFSILIDEE